MPKIYVHVVRSWNRRYIIKTSLLITKHLLKYNNTYKRKHTFFQQPRFRRLCVFASYMRQIQAVKIVKCMISKTHPNKWWLRCQQWRQQSRRRDFLQSASFMIGWFDVNVGNMTPADWLLQRKLQQPSFYIHCNKGIFLMWITIYG